jgi:hypothetical protein
MPHYKKQANPLLPVLQAGCMFVVLRIIDNTGSKKSKHPKKTKS